MDTDAHHPSESQEGAQEEDETSGGKRAHAAERQGDDSPPRKRQSVERGAREDGQRRDAAGRPAGRGEKPLYTFGRKEGGTAEENEKLTERWTAGDGRSVTMAEMGNLIRPRVWLIRDCAVAVPDRIRARFEAACRVLDEWGEIDPARASVAPSRQRCFLEDHYFKRFMEEDDPAHRVPVADCYLLGWFPPRHDCKQRNGHSWFVFLQSGKSSLSCFTMMRCG